MRFPFASASWEPRFAIEHHLEPAIEAAVKLWCLCAKEFRFGADDLVTHWTPAVDHLLIARPGDTVGHQALPAPVAVRALAPRISAWLATAMYPELPHLDDEAPGFCIYWSHYRCEEAGAAYGDLVVLPKWIEIHK
ncbi:hypothetical protein BH11MYX3_BH11MYX3_42290 [soil metagenome]